MEDCLNETVNFTGRSVSDRYNITTSCARFDFYLYSVAVGTTCIFGLFGNFLSFFVFLRDGDSNGNSATPFLLRALAVSDSLVLLAAAPLYVLPFVYPYTGQLEVFYYMYSKLITYLWPLYLIPYTGSVMLTVLVSVDRYKAVCRPFSRSPLFATKRIKIYVIGIIFFAVFYNIPRFFEYEEVKICGDQSASTFRISDFGSDRIYRILYGNALYFVIMHGGPLLSLGFLNVKLIQSLRLRRKRRAMMNQRQSGPGDRDITVVLVVVVFAFIFCQTPTFLDHVMWTFVDKEFRNCGNWHYYYTAVGDALAIFNSSINFVIYVLTSRQFRRSLGLCHGTSDGSRAWIVSSWIKRMSDRNRLEPADKDEGWGNDLPAVEEVEPEAVDVEETEARDNEVFIYEHFEEEFPACKINDSNAIVRDESRQHLTHNV